MSGISLNTYGNIARQDLNARLTLDTQNNTLGADGRRNISNIFTRAWDCINRSDSQIQSNKAVARGFVRALTERYGKEIADTLSQDLSAQLSKGRPLTGYRIDRVIAKAERLTTQIQASNRSLLTKQHLDLMTDNALHRLGDDTRPDVLTRQQARQAVHDAIVNSEAFQKQSFYNPLHVIMDVFGDDGEGLAQQQFYDHFKSMSMPAVDHAISMQLAPETTALVDQHGKLVIDQVCEGVAQQDRGQVYSIEGHALSTAKELLRSQDGLNPSAAGVFIGTIAYVDSSIKFLAGLDPSQMNDTGKAYLQAMINDLSQILDKLTDRIGLQGLSGQERQALIDINQDAGDFEQGVTEGKPQDVAQNCVELQDRLRSSLDVLHTIQAQNDKAKTVLETIIQRGEATRTIAGNLPIAFQNGLRPTDLLAGDPEPMLLRLGGDGFDSSDIAWMHQHGLNVSDTVTRFTLEQVQSLKTQGLDIETGLQRLDAEAHI